MTVIENLSAEKKKICEKDLSWCPENNGLDSNLSTMGSYLLLSITSLVQSSRVW